ncbi:MAG: aminotransferase class I/II-fold pyridoxal phosphate-dependent enzyme, partial [Flavobacteriales bacterium]|nr:aminotransferase class I/II-fold pyridoxal phosphate-dependent enzyme [Flavobacteriales bacterium]
IYLANVNNPTGTKISEKDLRRFISSIPDHILVIVDEAYFEFSQALDADFPNSMDLGFENVLTLRTFSKAYGIAGVRIGYGVGHPKIIEAMNKVRLTFEPGTLSQAAGIGALQDEDFLEQTIANNTEQMKVLTEAFDEHGIKYVPSYGNFVMTVWNSEGEVKNVFEKLMKRGVLVRPLAGGLDHCIRISVGRPEENKWLIENLALVK